MAPKELAAKKARSRADYAFHQEYRTRWYLPLTRIYLQCLYINSCRFDNDMYAHLNNTVYTMLFDSIINTYLITKCGMDPFSVNKDESSGPAMKQIAIIATSYCDYFASVAFPDVLELGLRVERLGKSSVTYEVGVFRKGEEDVKVVGGYTHVFCERETMRPAAEGMEGSVRKGLEELVKEPKAKL